MRMRHAKYLLIGHIFYHRLYFTYQSAIVMNVIFENIANIAGVVVVVGDNDI